MRHFVSYIGVATLIVLLTIQVLADVVDFKNPAAKTAHAEYHSALTQAERAKTNQVELARRKYLASLKTAQLDATKKGDLDDAIRIRDEIAAVEAVIAGASPDTLKPASKTPPTNETKWSYGDNRTVSFNSNGTGELRAQALGKVVPFQWARLPDDSVLLLADGYVDLLVFDADGKAFTKYSCGRKNNSVTLKGEPVSK